MLSLAALRRAARQAFFLLAIFAVFGAIVSLPAQAQEVVPPSYSACLQTAWRNRGDTVTSAQFQENVTRISASVDAWSCQRMCLSETEASANCVSRGCTAPGQDNTVKCCAPGVGSAPTAQNRCTSSSAAGAGGTSLGAGSSIGRFSLPECTKTGNCALGDIVNTGVRLANFLFGIAGLVFFASFVYAGAWMLFFAYDAGSYKKAKDILEKAVIGMVIMIIAGTLVRFVFGAFQASSTGSTSTSTPAAAKKDTPTTTP